MLRLVFLVPLGLILPPVLQEECRLCGDWHMTQYPNYRQQAAAQPFFECFHVS